MRSNSHFSRQSLIFCANGQRSSIDASQHIGVRGKCVRRTEKRTTEDLLDDNVAFNNYLYLPTHRTRLYVQKAKLCRWTERWYQDRQIVHDQWTHNFRVKCGSPFTRDICRYVPTDNAWILGGWMACLNCCCCCGCSLPFAAAGCIHLLLAGPAYL